MGPCVVDRARGGHVWTNPLYRFVECLRSPWFNKLDDHVARFVGQKRPVDVALARGLSEATSERNQIDCKGQQGQQGPYPRTHMACQGSLFNGWKVAKYEQVTKKMPRLMET